MKKVKTLLEYVNLPTGDKEIIEVGSLLGILEQSRIFHWQTPSYSEHKALGGYYEGLVDLIDSFTESAMGQVGVPRGNWTLNLRNYGEYDLEEFMNNSLSDLKKMKTSVSEDMSDLQNILDEMIGLTTRTRYLLHLQG